MKTFELSYLIEYARKESKYYQSLYSNNAENISFDSIPIVDCNSFWSGNIYGQDNAVLTGPASNGIVLKSDKVGMNPKFSVYTKEEYSTMISLSGLAFMHNGIQEGDRIANLFYGGQLHSSFLCVHDFIRACPVDVVEYPIISSTPLDEIVENIFKFNINVIAGLPTTILKIFKYAKKFKIDLTHVNRVYYSGETFYSDQQQLVHIISPGCDIRPLFYTAVGGGVVGYCDEDCEINEYRAYDLANLLEIVDEETGQVIMEPGVEGKLVATCLYRKLMPFIRYPLSDKAKWLEPEGTLDRKFVLVGCADEGVHVGSVMLSYEDISKVVEELPIKIFGHQLIVTNYCKKDKLTVRLAVDNPGEVFTTSRACLEMIYQGCPVMKAEIQQEYIHEISVEFCTTNALEKSPKTGKIVKIIDKRLDAIKEEQNVKFWG